MMEWVIRMGDGMSDGEWATENGRRRMGDGEWATENGRRRMGDGEWVTESG
jgi:hypothetical protein